MPDNGAFIELFFGQTRDNLCNFVFKYMTFRLNYRQQRGTSYFISSITSVEI